MKKCSLLLVFLSLLTLGQPFQLKAQDTAYARRMIDSLASCRMHGRGYVYQGDHIAAAFIAAELEKTAALPLASSYFQHFPISLNTFPGRLRLSLNDGLLQPADDYMIGSSSPMVSGTFKTLWLTKNSLSNPRALKNFQKKNLENTVLILDTGFADLKRPELAAARGLIYAGKSRQVFGVSSGRELAKGFSVYVPREKIPTKTKTVTVDIESVFLKNYLTQNVVAFIKGRQQPDSFLVFTAHYDHVGHMGAGLCFPGANDNASGCAMLLDLARHYSKPENAPDYSVAFLFFSGEEAGLLGSEYYAEHPLFPLESIKFLLNLDMVGTGSEGIRVVNGNALKQAFEKLEGINRSDSLLKAVGPRGESANSDHYWFYKKGVPSFFIYTTGPEWREYHTPADRPQGLPLTEYSDLFRLLVRFMAGF